MMNNEYILPPKGAIEIRQHFIERLADRCKIFITEEDYDFYCQLEYVTKNFEGKYKKNSNKTIGYLNIEGTKVVALYQRTDKRAQSEYDGKFATCYPVDIDKSDEELMRACFGQREIFKFATIAYNQFKREKWLFSQLPEMTMAEIGKYVFVESGFCFPQAMIEITKYGDYDKWHLCRRIRNIIFGYNDRVEMYFRKKVNSGTNVQECDATGLNQG